MNTQIVHKVKHFAKYRWVRSVAWVIRVLGFVYLYLAESRVDSRFFKGGFKLGYSETELNWFAAHYGGIAVGLILLSYLLEFIEAWLDSRKTLG